MQHKFSIKFASIVIVIVFITTFYLMSANKKATPISTGPQATSATPTMSDNLTADEIAQLSQSIAFIACGLGIDVMTGSGVFIKTDAGPLILTNAHVVTHENGSPMRTMWQDTSHGITTTYNADCMASFYLSQFNAIGPFRGIGILDKVYHDNYDYADLMMVSPSASGTAEYSSRFIASPNICPDNLSLDTKVWVFGYPLSGTNEMQGSHGPVIQPQLVVTQGVISGIDNAMPDLNTMQSNSSSPNYFTSAQVDSGNSGGLAVAKVNGRVCEIGLPTWVSQGNYANLGVIQSFHNINGFN